MAVTISLPFAADWLRELPILQPCPSLPISDEGWEHIVDSPLRQSAVRGRGSGAPQPEVWGTLP